MPLDLTPVDAGLFASLDPPRLAGARCADCGTVVFPIASSCPQCSSGQLSPVVLPDRGTVWTWTVQGFQPKAPYIGPPGDFVPYAVGYVDLGDLLVEARLQVSHGRLRFDLPVRLTVVAAGEDALVTFAFEEDA